MDNLQPQYPLVPGPWVITWHHQFFGWLSPSRPCGLPHANIVLAYTKVAEVFADLDHNADPATGAILPVPPLELARTPAANEMQRAVDDEDDEMSRSMVLATIGHAIDRLQSQHEGVQYQEFRDFLDRAVAALKQASELVQEGIPDMPSDDEVTKSMVKRATTSMAQLDLIRSNKRSAKQAKLGDTLPVAKRLAAEHGRKPHTGTASRFDKADVEDEEVDQPELDAVTTAKPATTKQNREKRFKCEVVGCPKSFTSPGGLRYHQANGHSIGPRPRIKCTVLGCDKTFLTPGDLQQHQKHAHRSEPNPIKCGISTCRHSFPNEYALERHEKSEHPELFAHHCSATHCLAKFKNAAGLKRHMTCNHAGK